MADPGRHCCQGPTLRRSTRVLVAVLVLALLPTTASAGTGELEQELREAQQERERTQQRLQELRGREGDARDRLAAVDAELAYEEAALEALRLELEAAENALEAAQQRLDDARDRLVAVNEELDEAEAEFREVKKRLESRIRASFKYGHVSFAEAFAGVRDIADFLNTTHYVSHVLSGDRELMASVEASLDHVERQRELARTLREEAEKEEAEAAKQAELIEEATAEQRRLAASVRERRQERAAALEALRTDRSALEGHLAGLEAESARIQAQIAAVLRRQAEEDHRRAVREWERAVEAWEKCQADNEKAKAEYEQALADYEAGQNGNGGNGNGEDGNGNGEGGNGGNGGPPSEPQLKDCGERPPSSPPPPPAVSGPDGAWIRPVNGRVSSPFGPRWGRFHYGVDLANSEGTPIRSSQSGRVLARVTGCNPSSSWGCGGGFGNYIVIDHGGGYATVYAHLASVGVSTGQNVSAGQTIGRVGNSGNSYGPHLHFEFYDQGVRRNPCNYIAC